MGKLLWLILIILLIYFVGDSIYRFSSNLPMLLLTLAVYGLIWFGLWKGTTFAVNNPEETTQTLKANIVRWILQFVYSIFAVDIAVTLAFTSTFLLLSYSKRLTLKSTQLGEFAGKVLVLIFLLVLAAPFIYLINRSLRFKNPFIPTFITTSLWILILLVITAIPVFH